ncbi:MAG TPA: hypothetical protein VFW63_04825 [Acidimicrobiales bacterium]|nr:hypothetical protein [Acidimicrobiales bacterium]
MIASAVRLTRRLPQLAAAGWSAIRRAAAPLLGRSREDRGEGVVSAAIVVLIMAALGALMWVGFRSMWTDIESDTRDRISEVGR